MRTAPSLVSFAGAVPERSARGKAGILPGARWASAHLASGFACQGGVVRKKNKRERKNNVCDLVVYINVLAEKRVLREFLPLCKLFGFGWPGVGSGMGPAKSFMVARLCFEMPTCF